MSALPNFTFCESLFAYVCLEEDCKVVVKLEHLRQHIQRKHRVPKPTCNWLMGTLLKAVEGKTPSLIAKRYFEDPLPRKEESPLPSIPDLPIYDIVKCPCCTLYLNGVKSCKAHMRSSHKTHEQYDALMQNVKNQPLLKGQSLFRGHARLFFPVTCGSPNIQCENSGSSLIISTDTAHEPRTVEADELSLHDKSVNLTCTILGIPEFLNSQRLTLEKAYDLSRIDGRTRANVVSVLLEYIEHFAKMQPPVPIPLLEGIKIRNGDNVASFSLSIEQRSKRRYAGVAARFISLAASLVESPLPCFDLDPDAKEAAEALLESITSSGTAKLDLVHRFFRATLLQRPRASMGELVTIEGLFKVLIAGYTCGVQSKRIRIGDSDDASHTAAAMQYFCHIAALGEFFVVPIAFGVETEENEDARFNRVRSLLSTEACSPAAYIRTVLLKSKRLSAGESPKIDFVACPNHAYCGTVENIEVPLNSDQPGSIGYVVRSLQLDINRILRVDLMQDFPVPADFVSSVLSFTDRLNYKEPGYFFGAGPEAREKLRLWSEAFARHLTKGRTPLIRMAEQQPRKEYEPTALASVWLRRVDEITFLLYVLVHLCGGGPPRVSEMVEAKLKNTAASRRNLFIIKQRLAIVGCYSKNAKQHQAPKPIARFLDSYTTEMLLLFVAYIKPVQCFLLKKSMLDLRATEDYLFCQSGEQISEQAVCKAFGKALSSRGLPLNVKLYRQWRTGVAKAFLDEEKHQTDDSLLFLQAGHTQSTAIFRYAGGDFNVGSLSLAKLEGFYNVSKMWHGLLGIGEKRIGAKPVPLQASHSPSKTLVGKATIMTCRGSKRSGENIVENEGAKKRTMQSAGCDKNGGSNKKLKSSGLESSNNVHVGGQLSLHNSILACARDLLGSSTHGAVKFKSEAQRAAVFECSLQTVLSGYTSAMIVILPTGGGKTLCWATAVLREQRMADYQRMTPPITLLIVPLISLQQDMLRKCQEGGLRSGQWNDRFNGGLSVIICSIDVIFSNDYERFMVALSVQGRIARIVVDEVHLVLLWRDLRRFDGLAGRLRPCKARYVPLVCLSATLPNGMVDKLQGVLRMDQSCIKVYRALNSRPNISYQVRMITEKRSKQMIEHCNQLLRMEMDVMNSSERAIAFCLTINDCVDMHKRFVDINACFDVCIYHGSMSTDEKKKSFATWISNKSEKPVAMIATSAFSCGIDYPHVRTVIHVGGSRSIVELAQESGRAGRDGAPSKNIIVYNEEYLEAHTTYPDVTQYPSEESEMFGDVKNLLGNKNRCRREGIESFLNENSRGPCFGVELKCDTCERYEANVITMPQANNSSNDARSQVYGPLHCTTANRKRVAVDPSLFALQSKSSVREDVFRNQSDSDCQSQMNCIRGPRQLNGLRDVVDESAHKDNSVYKWHAKQLSLAGCAVCLFSRRKLPKTSDHGSCMRAKCFRCMESNVDHQSKDCNVTPRGEEKVKRCFFCGIPQNKGLHSEGTFNQRGKCEWEVSKNLALLMWRNPGYRNELTKRIHELRNCRSIEEVGHCLCGGKRKETYLTRAVEYMYSAFVVGAK